MDGMRPDSQATARLEALLDRGATDDPDEDPDGGQWGMRPGWTPGEPDGARHRDDAAPKVRWFVNWQTALLFLLVVVLGIAGVGAWSMGQGAGTVVVPADPPSSQPTSAPPPAAAPSPTQSTPAPTGTPATATPLVVHVVGAVATPGVVTLDPGARVQDALDAAGGADPDADLRAVNLARPVQDGEQIPVPLPGETMTTAAPPAAPPAVPSDAPSGGSSAAEPAGGLVNINTASAAELETLPGVGPVLAGRIVQWRTDNGTFLSVDDLGEVKGIGDKVLASLRPLVTV